MKKISLQSHKPCNIYKTKKKKMLFQLTPIKHYYVSIPQENVNAHKVLLTIFDRYIMCFLSLKIDRFKKYITMQHIKNRKWTDKSKRDEWGCKRVVSYWRCFLFDLFCFTFLIIIFDDNRIKLKNKDFKHYESKDYLNAYIAFN